MTVIVTKNSIEFAGDGIDLEYPPTIQLGHVKASFSTLKLGWDEILQCLAAHVTKPWDPLGHVINQEFIDAKHDDAWHKWNGYYKTSYITKKEEVIVAITNLDQTETYVFGAILDKSKLIDVL